MPKFFVAALAILCLVESVDVAVTSSLRFDAVAAKNRPVTKVVTLLKDMLNQLEKEKEKDEEIYDAMACWCTNNDREKTKAIADAEAKINSLKDKIDELTALSARLATEIKDLEEEVAADKAALEKATSIREKQIEEFNAEEKDLLESIEALGKAIEVMSKHHRPEEEGASFLQVPSSRMMTLAVTVRHVMDRHANLLQGVFTQKERRAVSAFLQSPEDYFDAEPTFKQAYAPQSGAIFGILTQMKETFEQDLEKSQKEEAANQKAYEELKKAKLAEIKAGEEAIAKKTEQKADTDEKIVQAKKDLEETEATMGADMKYLATLKEKCALTDEEWEKRQKTRSLEMEAVSKAIAILSSDDAMDMFTRTFQFTQRESVVHSARRDQAAKVLSAAAKNFHNPRLATLAYRVRLDAFTRVKKAIDDMVATLLKEKEDEIKHKDFCVEELNTNVLQTEKKEREKADLIAKIEDLEMRIKELAEAIAKLKEEISTMQVELKEAGELREKTSKDFQLTISDQRESAKLCQAALMVLEDFYGKAKAAMLQKQEPAGPPPPPGFEEYKKSNAAGGVMSEIQQIIADAKAMEAEALKAEEESIKAYDEYVTNTNDSIEQKVKEIGEKSAIKADLQAELVETEAQKQEVLMELDELAKYNAELHTSCDFVLKNFDVRQEARDQEIEALKTAKAILSGAKFELFLQAR